MEYKRFLPLKYIQKKNDDKLNSKKRIVLLLCIYNLFVLPLNFGYISKNEPSEEIDESKINLNILQKEDILKWLELDSGKYLTINVSNGEGVIKLNNRLDLYKIEEAGFNIKEVKNNEKLYEIKVE